MHIDHKNISSVYAKLFESSSQHSLKHVIELQATYDSATDSTDLDLILDGNRISNTIIESPSEATFKLTKDVNNYLKEEIGNITEYVLPRLLDNLEIKLKEIIKNKTKRTLTTITRVVVSGTFIVTESLVGNY